MEYRGLRLLLYAVALALVVGVYTASSSNSPAVSSSPPTNKQYHPLSEIWINPSYPVDWKGLIFKNIKSIEAGKFVDKDNTNYYVDPSGSSVLNSVGVNSISSNIYYHSDSGTLYKTTNSHIEITHHDGCGNFQVKAGGYGCPAKYAGNNLGYAEIEMGYEGVNGYVKVMTAPKGSKGQSVSVSGVYTFYIDRFESNKEIRAPVFKDKDNTNYYVDPSGNSNVNIIYARTVCLNSDCSAKIYWDGSKLIIEAPKVEIKKP